MRNDIEVIEQAMNDKQRTALKMFDDFMEQQERTEFEELALSSYFKQIKQLVEQNATEKELDDLANELLLDSKMVGFVFGYVYAIDRLKETLLIQ